MDTEEYNAATREMEVVAEQWEQGLITAKEYWAKIVEIASIQFEHAIEKEGD